MAAAMAKRNLPEIAVDIDLVLRAKTFTAEARLKMAIAEIQLKIAFNHIAEAGAILNDLKQQATAEPE